MAALNFRERFALTLEHKDVDRPPMDLAGTDMTGIDGHPRRLAPALGLRSGPQGEELDEQVLRALDIDIRSVGGILSPQSSLARRISDTEISDCWGITSQHNGHHYEAVGRPLAGAGIDALEIYPWPDPYKIDLASIERIEEKARFLYEETPYVVCGRHPYFGIFELGCWMCGFDDFLFRMAAEPEFVHRFFEIILAYQKKVDDIYYSRIGRYLHFTTSGDDFGTQRAPFMSPEMFRESIVPFLAERIAHIRRHTGAAFFHHSCGAIRPYIPDLIKSGVQILNPIQPNATGMEPAGLKHDFGSSLAFYGGVDTQHLLPSGNPHEVFNATKDLMAAMSSNGGFILAPAHCIQEDVPPENAIALYKAGVQTSLEK